MDGDILLRRALAAVRTLRGRLDAYSEPIAVVGAACRLPGGATDLDRFWQLLRSGRDAVAERPGLGPAGRLAEDVRDFDAGFFGIAAYEAAEIDPQHRLLLETGWTALEEAGLVPARPDGAGIGVFVGISGSEFAMLPRDAVGPHTSTGSAVSVAAGRLAHTLGLRGPALAVDTACSSSLVAVHLAVQSLRRGECDAALAGGVNVLLAEGVSAALTEMGALAPGGRCRTFDAAADGYVRAEGAGMVALRRLSDAEAAGDTVLGVIRGSAVNQDGRTSGLTVPNSRAQAALIERALSDAGVRPDEVGYVEAHGTGTPLGDPLELRAIGEVFGDRTEPLTVGALKSAIGHAEAAAGIAGLLKVLLVLRHGEAPPVVHLREPNPRLELDRQPVTLPTAVTPIAATVAGVSSFGFSGTNAHVVVAAAPARAGSGAAGGPWAFPVSARDGAALPRRAGALADLLERHPEWALADVAYTLGARRPHFPVRRCLLAGDLPELVAGLRGLRARPAAEAGPVAFLAGDGDRDRQLELATRWQDLGVRPGAVAGGGAGALVAAYLAGVVDRAGLAELAAGRPAALRPPALRLVRAPGTGPVPPARVTDPRWWLAEQDADLSGAVRHLRAEGYRTLVDLGGAADHATVPGVDPGADLGADLVPGLVALYEAGVDLDWAALRGAGRTALPLPAHPFTRRRHWPTPAALLTATPPAATPPAATPPAATPPVATPPAVAPPAATPPAVAPPGAGAGAFSPVLVPSPLPQRQYEAVLDHGTLPELPDNGGILHIGYYAELLGAATGGDVAARDLEFVEALHVEPEESRVVQLVVEPGGAFSVVSRAAAGTAWSVHLRGRLRDGAARAGRVVLDGPARDALRAGLDRHADGPTFGTGLRARGFVVDGSVDRVEEVWWGPGEALARLRGGDPHPGVLDACVQLFAAAGAHLLRSDQLFITVEIGRYEVRRGTGPDGPLWCRLRLRDDEAHDGDLTGDLWLVDGAGAELARATGIRVAVIRLPAGPGGDVPAPPAGDTLLDRLGPLVADLLPDGVPGPDVPLAEAGLDSLAALELKRRITATLEVDVPMELLVQGPSLAVLAGALATADGGAVAAAPAHHRDASRRPATWLAHHRLTPDARVRLFCVPYGMKGASLYARWAGAVPAGVDVCPVQFPGKENRIEEKPIADITEAVEAMSAALGPYLDRPFALYGHSVGALVAYRVAHRLAAAGTPPAHLFVGAYSAPSERPNPVHAQVLESFREFGHDDLPDLESLVAAGGGRRAEYERRLGERFGLEITDELRRTVRPVGFSDFRLVHTYRHDPAEPPLPVPVTAFHGAADTYVSEEEMRGWAELTSVGFALHVFPGDHFFLHPDQHERDLLRLITGALAGPVGRPR